MQDMLLVIGSLVVEGIPSIYEHLLLLADIHYLSCIQDSWFITGINDPNVIANPQLYDVCFDIDDRKLYASNAIAV